MLATLADTVISDSELVEAVANGSEGALRDLYERHGPLIMALARRMLDSREEAEEVLHDALLGLWRHAGSFEPGRASVRTYLFSLARNLCITRLRARRARPRIHDFDESSLALQLAFSVSPDPLPAVMAGRALAAVDELDRQLLEEAFYGGWSHSELAARHELPLGTVKSRLRRALLKMREALEGPG